MNAALRAHAILADPAAEWPKIEVEPSDAAHLLTSYVALLALIPAISGFIGACVVGVVEPGGTTLRAPVLDGLFGAVFSYVMTCATVFVLALVINLLAPTFASRRGFDGAFKLAVYSYTPLWLAGIFLLAPGLRFLVLTGFYGAYLLWIGLPALMQTPGPKVPAYAAAIVACACMLTLIIAAAQHALFGLSRF
jgi:Yip1 domain